MLTIPILIGPLAAGDAGAAGALLEAAGAEDDAGGGVVAGVEPHATNPNVNTATRTKARILLIFLFPFHFYIYFMYKSYNF